MATNKPKTNVARSAKKQSFKFRWWYAVIAVIVVAVVGIAVLRYSHASTNSSINNPNVCKGTSCPRYK